MSTLTKPRPIHHEPSYSLEVYSDADAEIQLFDARLEKIGHGVGWLRVPVDRGLHKVRVVRADSSVEKLLDIQANEQISLYATPAYSVAPIRPVYGAEAPRIERLAKRAFGALSRTERAGGAILLLAHRDGHGLEDPLERVSLRLWRRRHVSVGEDGPTGFAGAEIGGESWSAWTARADPGMYELQLGWRLRQIVPVVPDWETRIFIRRSSARIDEQPARSSDGRSRSREFAAGTEVSIQLAKPDSPVVYWDHFESIEVARRALETERPIFASPRLIEELLHAKWENPLMGVTGAHLLLAALERDVRDETGRRPRVLLEEQRLRAPQVLEIVLNNLNGLLGEHCPADLAALFIRARRFLGRDSVMPAERFRIDAPPIYWSSWSALAGQRRRRHAVSIPRSVWSRVSRSVPIGPYFGWYPGRTSLDRQIGALLMQEFVSEPILKGMGLVHGPVFEASGERRLHVEEIARVLGAPPLLVEESASRMQHSGV